MILFLVGMPASGKSTLAQKIAIGYPFEIVDLDKYIEKTNTKTIQNIFLESGEEEFRKLEAKALRELGYTQKNLVVATGGGTPCFHGNMDFILQTGTVVFLDTPLEIILQRIQENQTERPMFQGKSPETIHTQLRTLYEYRKPFYQKAHYHILNEDDFFELNIL